MAIISRLIRASMLDILNEDFIRTARSKGLAERVVIYKHAFRNALIPTVTIFGVQIPELISLGVIIETVFAWPGTGRMLVDAVLKRDYTLVQGIVLVYVAAGDSDEPAGGSALRLSSIRGSNVSERGS